MKGATAANVKQMVDLVAVMDKKLRTHEDFLTASIQEMNSRALVKQQEGEINKLKAALAAAERANEKLKISYFKNNERRRMVMAYNQMHDEKEALKRTIEGLTGNIADMKLELKRRREKSAVLAMEAGQHAGEIDG